MSGWRVIAELAEHLLGNADGLKGGRGAAVGGSLQEDFLDLLGGAAVADGAPAPPASGSPFTRLPRLPFPQAPPAPRRAQVSAHGPTPTARPQLSLTPGTFMSLPSGR